MKLKGYTVDEAYVNLPANGQGSGSANCPSGDRIVGGGVYQGTSGLGDDINGSYPESNGDGWTATFNNAVDGTDTGVIVAVCATATSLKDYSVQFGSVVTIPAGGDAQGTVTCPGGTVSLGGGANDEGTSTSAAMISSAPYGTNGWRSYMGSAGSSTQGYAAVVCATEPTGWAQVNSSYETNPAGDTTIVTVKCPTGTHILGGGPFTSSVAPTVSLAATTSLTSLRGWHSYENNNSSGNESVDEWGVCATTVAAS